MPIVAENFGELEFSDALPPSLRLYEIAGARVRAATGPFGHVLIQHFRANGFVIFQKSYILNRFATFTCTDPDPCLHLRLQVNNSMRCHLGLPHAMQFHERGYNISYMPELHKRMHFRKAGHYTVVEIHFKTDTLHDLKPMFPVLSGLTENVHRQEAGLLIPVNQVATPKMLSIMRDMLFSGYTGEILNTYLAAKARELLVMCLERVMNNPLPAPIRMPEKEIERIYEARDTILQNLAKEWTMMELARGIGLTQYKLKSGFLELFGTTVAAYQRDARMEKARMLLQDASLSLAVIAEMVGYTNPNSFSLAYKNYFGISPAAREL
jgi:AraC-like DNA-binding protein